MVADAEVWQMSRITNPTRARGQEGECFPKGSIAGDSTEMPKDLCRFGAKPQSWLRSV